MPRPLCESRGVHDGVAAATLPIVMNDKGSLGSSIDETEFFDSDPDRDVILARRRLFLLVAVTGLASVPACGGRVQYDGMSISSGATTELDAGSPGGALQGVGGAAAFPTTLVTGGSNAIGNTNSGGATQTDGANTSSWGGSSFTAVGGWASVGGASFYEATGGAVDCAGVGNCEVACAGGGEGCGNGGCT